MKTFSNVSTVDRSVSFLRFFHLCSDQNVNSYLKNMGSVSHHQLPDLLNFIYFLFFLPTLTGYHPESIICIKVQSWWCGFYGFRQMYNDVYRHYSMMKHGFIAPRTTLLSIHKLEDAMSTSPSISIDNTSFLPTRLSAWLQYTYKQTKYFTEVKGM